MAVRVTAVTVVAGCGLVVGWWKRCRVSAKGVALLKLLLKMLPLELHVKANDPHAHTIPTHTRTQHGRSNEKWATDV